MKSANRLIIATLAISVLAIAFWVLALGPKRQEASDLSSQVDQASAALAESRFQLAEAAAARRKFPADYRQLVVLGKAVPGSDDTSSLLVELGHVAHHSEVTFDSIQLNSTTGGEATAAAPAPVAPTTPTAPTESSSGAVPAAATVPPTEAAASVLPLGATVGTAGLGVMPYKLNFSGDFFQVADFIKGIDSLVKTGRNVAVDGRLMTLDGFALVPSETDSSTLEASFAVTTYLVPPTQGVIAGATPTAPAPATEAAAPPASESTPSTSTPVSAAQ